MTAARFAFRPAKGDAARIELYDLIQPAACSQQCGQVQGNERDDTLSTGRMLIGRARQGFPPEGLGLLGFGVKERDASRPSADKLSAPLYKAHILRAVAAF